MTEASGPRAGQVTMDPVAVIRSRAYLSALVLAALLGIPISAVAYGFLALVSALQGYLFEDLPADLFADGAPAWWPVPWLALCGLLVGLTIQHLPGNAGHSPRWASRPVVGRQRTASCPASFSPPSRR